MRVVIVLCIVALYCCAVQSVLGSAVVHGVLADVRGLDLTTARVIADGGKYVSPVDDKASFVFPALPVGSHVLEVSVGDAVFPPVRIDVMAEPNRYRAYVNDGSERLLVNAATESNAADAAAAAGTSYPRIVLHPVGRLSYFVPREGFSVMSILKNPMVLMMVFSLGMVYVMPLIADQDEMRAQMKDMQKTLNQAQGGAAVPNKAVKQK